jgi:hypothetical protein
VTTLEETTLAQRTLIHHARMILQDITSDAEPLPKPEMELAIRTAISTLRQIETELGDSYTVTKRRSDAGTKREAKP